MWNRKQVWIVKIASCGVLQCSLSSSPFCRVKKAFYGRKEAQTHDLVHVCPIHVYPVFPVKSISSRLTYLCMYFMHVFGKSCSHAKHETCCWLSKKQTVLDEPHSVLLPNKWGIFKVTSYLIVCSSSMKISWGTLIVCPGNLRTESLYCVSPKNKHFYFCPNI